MRQRKKPSHVRNLPISLRIVLSEGKGSEKNLFSGSFLTPGALVKFVSRVVDGPTLHMCFLELVREPKDTKFHTLVCHISSEHTKLEELELWSGQVRPVHRSGSAPAMADMTKPKPSFRSPEQQGSI